MRKKKKIFKSKNYFFMFILLFSYNVINIKNIYSYNKFQFTLYKKIYRV